MTSPRVIALVNLKGGSAKTTSTAFLAHALAERGRHVVVIDADPQGSTMRWHGLADWPLPVMGLASSTLHRQLWGVLSPEWDTVVIDTPPLEDKAGIVASAMRVATDLVIPLGASTMELDRLPPVGRAIEDSKGTRDTDPLVRVLINRTVAGANSTQDIRAEVHHSGYRTFTATIPRLERYAQALGVQIPPGDPAYGMCADELLADWTDVSLLREAVTGDV